MMIGLYSKTDMLQNQEQTGQDKVKPRARKDIAIPQAKTHVVAIK